MAQNPASGAYISHTIVTVPNDAMAVSFHMRSTSTTKSGIFSRCSNVSAGGGQILFNDTAGKLSLYYKSNGNVDLGTNVNTVTVNDGNWHGVFATLPGQNGLGYDTRLINVDGTEVTGTLSFACDSAKELRLGRTSDTFFGMYVGDLAEFAVYNAALTLDERNALTVKKLTPLVVCPQKISLYHRLVRDTNDVYGDFATTINGSFSVADHPFTI